MATTHHTTTTTAAPAPAPAAGTTTPTHPDGRVHRGNRLIRALMFFTLFAFGLIELGLTGHWVHFINNDRELFTGSARRRMKYALFCAVFTTVLALVYLIMTLVSRMFGWAHHLGFLLLNFIFWIIAAALVEHLYGDFNDNRICSAILGSGHCRELKAIRAFAWILTFLSLIFLIVDFLLNRREKRAARDATGTTLMTHRHDAAPVTTKRRGLFGRRGAPTSGTTTTGAPVGTKATATV